MKRFAGMIALGLFATGLACGQGIVCIDPITITGEAKSTASHPTSTFSVAIDKMPAQAITTSSCGVFTNLDLEADHTVKIQRDGKPEASFKFSFKARKADHLRLWYRTQYGTWQLWTPGKKHECAYLTNPEAVNQIPDDVQPPSDRAPKRARRTGNVLMIHIEAAWIGFLLGCLAGAVPGLFFHQSDWLGGYASWPRRMIRLAHIAFFGIGFLNLAFALTAGALGMEAGLGGTSVLLILGAVTMPAVCYLAAWMPMFKDLFFIPALSITIGIVLFAWRIMML